MCEKKVYDFCIDNRIQSSRLLLAVSGGSDSVALLHLIHSLRKDLDIKDIGVAHVNHGIRPSETEYEENFVSMLSKRTGSRFHCIRLEGKKQHDSGLEQWARNERYTFFSRLKEEFEYQFVATGHTADDQAETVLMQVSRGCGVTGLCGVQPVRDDGVIRPLLQIRKNALRSWLHKRGESWREDPSNRDLRYKRNKIRHVLIPRLLKREPKAVEYLGALAIHISKQVAFLEPLVNKWISDNVVEGREGCFIVQKSKTFPNNCIAIAAITTVFRKNGIPFDRKDIKRFFIQAKRTSGCFLLKGGWRYYPAKSMVEIVSNRSMSMHFALRANYLLKVPGKTLCNDRGYQFITAVFKRDDTFVYDTSNRTVFLDAQKTGQTLLFRPIRKTDVFQPLGYRNRINALRYLKKQKISDHFRRSTGVLADKDDLIVWIPGVAIDHKSRITHATEKVFKISFERTS